MSAQRGAGALALFLLFVDLSSPSHGSGWHGWPGFELIYGLVGCISIVVGSKALGKVGVQRKEDFYDEPDAGPSE